MRGYWRKISDVPRADHIFRMFEPDGQEAFSCGNGLLCSALHLLGKGKGDSARVLTQLPRERPNVVELGRDGDMSSVEMGAPVRIPDAMQRCCSVRAVDSAIDFIGDLAVTDDPELRFPGIGADGFSLSGYLVHVGEPHLVFFDEAGMLPPSLSDLLFVHPFPKCRLPGSADKRLNLGSRVLHKIGTGINRRYSDYFPKGININFARVLDPGGLMEYRSFERGIYRETLACGTGALAAAVIAYRRGRVTSGQVILWPHRCRWFEPDAEIRVDMGGDNLLLYGEASLLFDGDFRFG